MVAYILMGSCLFVVVSFTTFMLTCELLFYLPVYIAGKIEGTKDYEDRFNRVKHYANALGYWRVYNPVNFNRTRQNAGKKTYAWFMSRCIRRLRRSAIIMLLPDWEDSPGALREHAVAEEIGLKIVYLTWEDLGYSQEEIRQRQQAGK